MAHVLFSDTSSCACTLALTHPGSAKPKPIQWPIEMARTLTSYYTV
jgi:hypothetical protein